MILSSPTASIPKLANFSQAQILHDWVYYKNKLKIAPVGNTIIRIATTGTEQGTRWTVYPYLVPDPTFQNFIPAQQARLRELGITGIQSPQESNMENACQKAQAIAGLKQVLVDEQNADLGLVPSEIDIEPNGAVAKILKTEYCIKPLETEGEISPENKG